MKIDDVEYDFRQSLEHDDAIEQYKAQLYTCKECGGHFTDENDLSCGICHECWEVFQSVEQGH